MVSILAFITGALLSIMIFFNSALGNQTSPIISNILFHGIGFIVFSLLLIRFKRKNKDIEKVPWSLKYILPGVMGSLTVIINNWVVFEIGVSLMIGLGLLGQMLTSLCIDFFGLLGRPKVKIARNQWLGIGIMSIGLVLMVL